MLRLAVIRRTTAIGVMGAMLAMAAPAAGAEADLRLVAAAARQDGAAVRTLISEGVDVDARRPDGVTALLWAAHRDDLETAEFLLAAHADANAADDHGVTPLIRAAENASPTLVNRLLDAGADANASQANGLTPLMVAARTGNLEVVRGLLTHGADVNAATTEVAAPALMWAVAAPHRAIVEALLDAGADVRVSTSKGMTPLLTVARNGDIDTARLLLVAGADINGVGADGTHALPFAIIHGRDDFARFLLDQGADPNGAMAGVSALHAAAGVVDRWLIHWDRAHGAARRSGGRRDNGRVNLDADRRPPLVEALLRHGADPNRRITTTAMLMEYIGYPKKGAFEPFACGTGNLRGATPLWVAAFEAASSGFYRRADGADAERHARAGAAVIQALLAAGADQSLTTDDGTTPFMIAAGLGRSTFRPNQTRGTRSPGAEAAVKLLLAGGADINAVNEADFTALHGAAFRGLNEVVKYLVAQGADIDAREYRGRTPFRLAEGSKQSFQFQAFPETAELLAEMGANTRLGVPGTVQERADRLVTDAAVP